MASIKQTESKQHAKIIVETADGRHSVRVEQSGEVLFRQSCGETKLQGPMRPNLKGIYRLRNAAVSFCLKNGLDLG